MKKRCPPLAICIEIIKDGQDDQDSQDGIQGDEKEIIDFGSSESCLIESLEDENNQMDNQK